MASSVRLLLRLPPAIRQQLFIQESSAISCLRNPTLFTPNGSRSFSLTTYLAKQGDKGKAMYRNAQPQKPTPSAKDLPKPGSAPSPAKASRPYVPPTPTLRDRPVFSNTDWLSTRFPKADQVLLYVAPRHGAFFVYSYIIGIGFLTCGYFSAVSYQHLVASQDSTFMYILAGLMTSFPVLFLGVVGTQALLAPSKMIKSISAVRAATTSAIAPQGRSLAKPERPWTLKFEVKRRFAPGAAPTVLQDVAPEDVFSNKNVHTTAEGIRSLNVDLKDAARFTEDYMSGALEKRDGSMLNRFSRGLLDTWPILKRETKRVMLRDQMLYVGVKGVGNMKLDLQGSILLDNGKVMERLVQEDPTSRPSISNWFKQIMG